MLCVSLLTSLSESIFAAMSLTHFAMVEELASLVKDNIPCKHLILSMEDTFVNFLQDDTSADGVLELEPMNPYNRLLVHRLADIFGFSHQSVGEGEDRHLILERCPETSMPPILVSDLLWQFGDVRSSVLLDRIRLEEVIPGQRHIGTSGSSLEARQTPNFAAGERLSSETKQRPQNNPVVARRMITRALGRTNDVVTDKLNPNNTTEPEWTERDCEIQYGDDGSINSINDLEMKLSTKHLRACSASKSSKFHGTDSSPVSKVSQQKDNLTKTSKGSSAERKEENIEDNLRKEHVGAAKRLFANALGIHRRDVNLS